MKLRILLVSLAIATALGGCAKSVTISPEIAQASLNTVRATLTFYDSGVQPLVLAYGQLPTCATPRVVLLCKDNDLWQKIKATDAAVVASIVAAQAVLHGEVPEAGQIMAAVKAIQNASVEFTKDGLPIPAIQ